MCVGRLCIDTQPTKMLECRMEERGKEYEFIAIGKWEREKTRRMYLCTIILGKSREACKVSKGKAKPT